MLPLGNIPSTTSEPTEWENIAEDQKGRFRTLEIRSLGDTGQVTIPPQSCNDAVGSTLAQREHSLWMREVREHYPGVRQRKHAEIKC